MSNVALGTVLFTGTFKELFESLFGAQDIVQLVECLIHLQEYMVMFSSTEKKNIYDPHKCNSCIWKMETLKLEE